MVTNYRRRTAKSSVLPLSKLLGKHWNDIHDMADGIRLEARDYDHAASFDDADAKKVLAAVKDFLKAKEALTKTMDELDETERGFEAKHGPVQDYIRELQDKAGFR